ITLSGAGRSGTEPPKPSAIVTQRNIDSAAIRLLSVTIAVLSPAGGARAGARARPRCPCHDPTSIWPAWDERSRSGLPVRRGPSWGGGHGQLPDGVVQIRRPVTEGSDSPVVTRRLIN